MAAMAGDAGGGDAGVLSLSRAPFSLGADRRRILGPEVLAFRVRLAAAPVQKEFSFAGWLQSAEFIKVDSSSSSSGSDKDMS
ncbi:hypothetical protein PVAP13_9KG354126 [Panicum virgatum]|uniref:Uncharacterized protein n=1 Tax=Panicum virgatum TaxID=38727 RepID=A0A8T0NM86_PANVG|nr:hypothetical protein PVAP13_9KG354126 [Panicum virgatum]